MLVVAKPVTCTLDPNRPPKTGRRYNDILSCFGKAQGVSYNVTKTAASFHYLLCDLLQKPHWRVIPPPTPVAEIRVKEEVKS